MEAIPEARESHEAGMDLQRFDTTFKVFVATYLVVWGWVVLNA